MEQPWLSAYEPGVAATLSYPEQSLGDLLSATARRYPDTIATNFILSYVLGGRFTVGGRLSYRQLNDLVDRMAAALADLGVRQGERVGLMLPNSPHYVISFFAAMRLGAWWSTSTPPTPAASSSTSSADAGAETIVLLNLFWPRLREVRAETPIKRVIVAHIFDTLGFPSSLLVRRAQRTHPGVGRCRPGAGHLLLPATCCATRRARRRYVSSRTTWRCSSTPAAPPALPKAAMLTHRNLIANVTQVRRVGDRRPAGPREDDGGHPLLPRLRHDRRRCSTAC